MSEYGEEYAEVYNEEWRKTRKPRRCDACHEAIALGQKYHRTFTIFDGDVHVNERCERCQAIFAHLSDRLRKEGDHDEYCNEDLNCGHEYEERWNEPPPASIAALAFWRPGDPIP